MLGAMRKFGLYITCGLLLGACKGASGSDDGYADASTGTGDGSTSNDSADTTGGDGDGDMTPKLDVDPGDTGDTGPDGCKVDPDGMDAAPPCEDKAPPDSFDPEPQWSWKGPQGFEQSVVTPLVVNLTDDNSDGEIDLCDTPDVVVVAGPGQNDIPPSRIYVLDGATGEEHFFADELVQWGATPAVGDIDDDGIPEIVSVEPGNEGHLLAFEHDGTLKWTSDEIWPQSRSRRSTLGSRPSARRAAMAFSVAPSRIASTTAVCWA